MEKKQYYAIEAPLLQATINLLNELPIRMANEVTPIINALVQCPKLDITEPKQDITKDIKKI